MPLDDIQRDAKLLKRKLKGTADSPCVDICTYKQGDRICRACGMMREEKKSWTRLAKQEKANLRQRAQQRLAKQAGSSSRAGSADRT